jgi:hypothetical protein
MCFEFGIGCALEQATSRRNIMPGLFTDDVHIYQCGTRPDGTAIYCSEVLIGTLKIPFPLESEDASSVGWREVDKTDIHIPLTRLVEVMKKLGITVTYDEDKLVRRPGPPYESA